MRKTLLVIGICIVATPAWAGGGLSLFGSYGGIDNHEYVFGAGARVTLGGETWAGDLSWTWYPFEDGIGTVGGVVDSMQVIPTELGVRLFLNPRGKVIPYLGAGFTFFYVNVNDGSADNTLGGYAMFGINFGGRPTKFFVEALYRYGQTDLRYNQIGGTPVSGSMDLGGFAANIGVAWLF